MTASAYQLLSELYRDEPYVVYRARRLADGKAVLLKSPLRQPALPGHVESLRRELQLLRGLHAKGVPTVLDLWHEDAACALVFEDHGGEPLAAAGLVPPLDLATFFHIALQVASILEDLHRRELVHGNVRPSSMLVHPESRELWLLGFDLATRLGAGTRRPLPAASPARALAYAAPERAGRTNLPLDHRADFYSAGIAFYELLSGRHPFAQARTREELVHAHLARTPEPPSSVVPALPEALSRLVMKLLEKTPEARYRSAWGLRADLERTAREWSSRRAVEPFPLGVDDVADRLLVPNHLYGREREVRELLAAFERAGNGDSALLLVSGYSGVGKTSLIQELDQPIRHRGGRLLAGKFDQVARSVPYGAVLQAFRTLVEQLLLEGEELLAGWRARLHAALGANAGVLTEVVPEMQRLLGEQPPTQPLGAAEAQNRFQLVFQDFVGALAAREHPLVLFLDDLQWADAASLGLLRPLLAGSGIGHLLVVGAYRANEVDVAHPLARTIADLEHAGARVERIALAPLGLADLARFVGDSLSRHDEETVELARLVHDKTEGNPFFVVQFLETMCQEGLLRFDHDRRRWVFRRQDVARAPLTDNVVDLMSRRIERLAPATRRLLTLAACVGSPFELDTLAIVAERSVAAAALDLQEALDAGLVLPATQPGGAAADTAGVGGAYVFLHDRVQQAAYARLPETARAELHLAVGRLLLRRWDEERAEERVFDVVGHLNLGRNLLRDPTERLAVARRNLSAGRRAKSSAAFDAALGYFAAGLELLADASWDEHYALLFEMHREAAECAFLCGHHDAAERRFEELRRRARSTLDQAQIYALRVVQQENLSRFAAATRLGLEGAAVLGVDLPRGDDDKRAALESELAAVERLVAGRAIDSLADLPVMAEPETRMLLRLLTELWAPAYIEGDGVLASLVSARMVRLSIEGGNCEDSAYGYVTHAITVGPVRGDYRAAYEWGALALAVNERFDDRKLRAKIHQQFNAHVAPWRKPFEVARAHAREACRSGLESGDFAYAGYGAFTESWAAFLASRDLGQYLRELEPNLAVLQRIRTRGLAAAHRVMLQWGRALQGQTAHPLALDGEPFAEAAFVAEHGENPFFMTVFWIAKLHLATLHEHWDAALEAARRARGLGWGEGTVWPVLLDFWGGLALAATAAAPPAGGSIPEELGAARRRLDVLAASCPENFSCQALLLEAEEERLRGRFVDALDRCEQAIRQARSSESLQLEALAQELSGRLWQGRDNALYAAVHFAEAHRCYREWGAEAKVRQLEERHPPLAIAGGEERAPSLDVVAVGKAAHALSVEIVLEELLRKLMRIALENAGATRGVFLRERAGSLVIEAQADVRGAAVSLAEPRGLDQDAPLCRGVAQLVRRTGESVVVADAARDRRCAGDPWVRAARPRSILCLPVVHQGKSAGILYLENGLAAGAFTAERVQVLQLLAAQAAISLENARLWAERTEEVARRKRAEDDLRAALREVETLKNRLQAENVYLQEEISREHNFEEIVGTSAVLREVLRRVERIAPTDATVLIGGETGTGKELIARAIHDLSRRRGRPLVKVNCAAISAGLVESELFGHVRGAFTGALERRVGRFELAHGGTLFLDEVGELPLETQAKLLRVLQEGEFEPVGSSRTQRVDVRLIAATNRDLPRATEEGRFRADLYYRLAVVPLRLPPLRERGADVVELALLFAARCAQRLGRRIEGLGAASMELLLRYHWPGNVRELHNVIERAVVLTVGPTLHLDPAMFPAAAGFATGAPREAVVAGEDGCGEWPSSGGSPPTARAEQPSELVPLDEAERRHILAALARAGGVIAGPRGAAQLLGMHANTLRSRMKKLGIGAAPR